MSSTILYMLHLLIIIECPQQEIQQDTTWHNQESELWYNKSKSGIQNLSKSDCGAMSRQPSQDQS